METKQTKPFDDRRSLGLSLAILIFVLAVLAVVVPDALSMREPDVAKDPVGANSRALTSEIRKARELTDGIIGVNIMVAMANFAELVKTAIKENVDAVFSGAGLPLDLPSYLTEG